MSRLYVAATPIGNLQDASPRLLATLKGCQIVLCEDTRVTHKLYSAFGMKPPRLVSCHQHNERSRAAQVIQEMLETTMDVALVTDAGSPCISDPGYLLVQAAVEAGIEVVTVPGPTAVTAALSVSGFEVASYGFFGFLPRQGKERGEAFSRIRQCGLSVAVVYESPHRVKQLVKDASEQLPGAMLSLSCDLTKLYEKTLRGSAEAVLQALEANPNAEKGEYVLVLDLSTMERPQAAKKLSARAQLLDLLLDGKTMKEAVGQVSAMPGYSRNEAYKASLQIGDLFAEEDE